MGLRFDADILAIHDTFKHMHPDFTLNHVLVYKTLWRIEPLNGDRVIDLTGLSRPTVYRILKELVAKDLVKKTNFRPTGYYADNPMKKYSIYEQKVLNKLKKGKEEMKKALKNSSSLSEEKYFIKKEGGQTKLISLETRQTLSDGELLKEYRDGITRQLENKDKEKLKAWQMIGR